MSSTLPWEESAAGILLGRCSIPRALSQVDHWQVVEVCRHRSCVNGS